MEGPRTGGESSDRTSTLRRGAQAAWLAALAICITSGCQRRPDGRTATDRRRPVLLVTHPTPRVLRAVRTLFDHRLLDVPRLTVVGLYHVDERHRYLSSRALVARHEARKSRLRLTLRALRCPVRAGDMLRRPNACTRTFERLFARSAGLIVPGGADIPPAFYGQPTHLGTRPRSPARQRWEISLLAHLVRKGGDAPLIARRPDYPVLGICMGMQALNVALGGDLIQDIPSQLYGHRSYEAIRASAPESIHRNPQAALQPARGVTRFVMHPIRLDRPAWRAILGPDSPALRPGARTFWVGSSHHQAIGRLGAGLVSTARSPDGKVIEAVRHARYRNVLGVQYHPELSALWRPGTRAKRHAGDMLHNFLFTRLAHDGPSLAFHRAFWRWFSRALR